MLVKVLVSELADALKVVSRGVATRTTLPILTGISVEAFNDKLKLRATDLEVSVECSLPVSIEEEGNVVVPAKPFIELINSLEEGMVLMISDVDGTELKLNLDSEEHTLRTLPPGDFPQGRPVPEGKNITVRGNDFVDAVKKTVKSASRDETRVVLTGIYMASEKNSLIFAATDSYRLATVTIPCSNIDSGIEVIIPHKALEEVIKIVDEDDDVDSVITDTQIYFIHKNWIFSTRLIDGQFPSFKPLFPESCDVEVTVDKKRLVEGIERLSFLRSNTVTFEIGKEKMTIKASSADFGSSRKLIDVESTGEIEITFNRQYILDGLKSINSETVRMEIQEGLNPAVLRPLDSEDFSYLLMPVKSPE